MNNLTIAIISGLLYFIGTQRVGYGLSTATGSPIVSGFIFGLLYNDVETGLIIGASIQLLYLGLFSPAETFLMTSHWLPVSQFRLLLLLESVLM